MIQDELRQPIELYLSGRSLRDKDMFSKSDPYIKVSYKKDFNAKNYMVLGRTETINNELNPNFSKTICLDYIFESRQDIKFEVFDDDNGNDDWLGGVETTVGALMGSKNQTSILELAEAINKPNQKKSLGKLIIRCEKVGSSGLHYQMKFRAKKLMNTDSIFDFWDKSDPYLKLMKYRNDNSLIPVQKTEYIKDNLNPSWKPITIQSEKLHSATNPAFKIECWDWEKSGKDQFIGSVVLNVEELKHTNYPLELKLENPKSKKAGHLILEHFKGFNKPSFVDYLKSGLELNMVIAIDFTGSNGPPHEPNSLHYMNPNAPNQYQMAINSIAQILLNYDSDKRIPSFGFGAKLKFPNMECVTSHCFPLSGNPGQVESAGLQHLMHSYKDCLTHIQLSGPTYFGPIIEQVAQIAAGNKQSNQFVYQTLLILTDGAIHDMDKVTELIIRCTELPVSIIIVGVGSADFGAMQKLDGDEGLFDSKGKRASRDLVQFVPFRKVQMNSDMLARQLLAELPNQITQYFQAIGRQPNVQQNVPMANLG